MWNRMSLGLGLLGGLALACLAPVCFPGEKKSPAIRINAEDLCSGKYEIVGRLGKPYGEISKVRAVWEENKAYTGKDIAYCLRITQVDEVELRPDRQIVIPRPCVRRLEAIMQGKGHPPFHGEVVEGRVFESGGYVRYPDKVIEILGGPRSQDPHFGFEFYSFLYLID